MGVSVPVNNTSYDSGLMQPSPQMSHSSLSPRPGSSTGILDMNGSNGYTGSTSPLPGGAPSPSLLSRPHKTHSPSRPNLRVLIPNSQAQSVRNFIRYFSINILSSWTPSSESRHASSGLEYANCLCTSSGQWEQYTKWRRRGWRWWWRGNE